MTYRVFTGLLVSLLIFTGFGCGSGGDQTSAVKKENGLLLITNESFSQTFNVEVNKIASLDTQLSNPKFIVISDSLMLIRDGNTDNDIFKFFRVSDFKLIGSFGDQGEGPGEVSSPAFVNQGAFKADSIFEYLDWGRRVLQRFNVDSVLYSERPLPEYEYSIPSNVIMLQRAFLLNDNYLVGSGGMRKDKLVKIDTRRDSIISSTPFTPVLKEELGNRSAGYIYAGEIAPNEDKERIAVTTQRFKTLEIYDYDLNLISDTRFDENPVTILGDENSIATGETVIHYSNITISDNYIFLLYSGNNYDDLENAFYGDTSNLKESEIHVFDWNGEPVFKMVTDSYLSAISFDKLNNRIVGVAPYMEDYHNYIVYLDIPF